MASRGTASRVYGGDTKLELQQCKYTASKLLGRFQDSKLGLSHGNSRNTSGKAIPRSPRIGAILGWMHRPRAVVKRHYLEPTLRYLF